MSWESKIIENLNVIIEDGDRGKNYPKSDDFFESGYCGFLNTGNVAKNGLTLEGLLFITKEKDEILRKGKLKRNDIILTTRGTLGNVGFYDDSIDIEHIRINSGMVILRPDDNYFYPKFFYYCIRNKEFQQQINNSSSGSAQL